MATPDFADVAARSKSLVQVLLPTTPSAGPGAGGESAYGADARGALEAWMETAGRAGSVDARALSSALRGAAIATRSLGVIRFDLNGDLDTAAFVAASAKAGQWVIDEK
jgi:ABC-type branched-subunit amino acid transport system substrate-binding protein